MSRDEIGSLIEKIADHVAADDLSYDIIDGGLKKILVPLVALPRSKDALSALLRLYFLAVSENKQKMTGNKDVDRRIATLDPLDPDADSAALRALATDIRHERPPA